MMASDIFEQVKDMRQKVLVGMDGVKFLAFGTEGRNILLTQDLNGCSGVVIVSRLAAILAHIAPCPDMRTNDPNAGLKHVRDRMREVMTLYQTYRGYFIRGNETLVISAMNECQISLPHHKELIEKLLEHFELTHATVTYLVLPARQPRWTSKGTIVIDGRRPIPQVYVEDQLILPSRTSIASEAVEDTPQSTSRHPPTQYPIRQTTESPQSTSRHTPAKHTIRQATETQQSTSRHTPTRHPAGHATETLQSSSRRTSSVTELQQPPQYIKSTPMVIEGREGRLIDLSGRKFIPNRLWQRASSNGKQWLLNQEMNVYTDAES